MPCPYLLILPINTFQFALSLTHETCICLLLSTVVEKDWLWCSCGHLSCWRPSASHCSFPAPEEQVKLVTMGRMHSAGKGMSKSARPYKRTPPSWLKVTSEDVEEHICKFAKKGLTPSQIGVILRDSHGIAQVKSVTGSKVLRLLKKNGACRRSLRCIVYATVPRYADSLTHCCSCIRLPPTARYCLTCGSTTRAK